jgi:hypothetical protein
MLWIYLIHSYSKYKLNSGITNKTDKENYNEETNFDFGVTFKLFLYKWSGKENRQF